MKKKAGIVLLAAGAALMLAALLLFFQNRREEAQAEAAAQEALAQLLSAMEAEPSAAADDPPQTAAPGGMDEADGAAAPLDGPDVLLIDGEEYLGVLSIPALELQLPVFNEWSYARLKKAPCRQFGAVETDDLVIAAHNYASHFGRLRQLSSGDSVLFTDASGAAAAYVVERVQVIEPTAIEAVQKSGYPLTLYTCTKGGAARVAVFCRRG